MLSSFVTSNARHGARRRTSGKILNDLCACKTRRIKQRASNQDASQLLRARYTGCGRNFSSLFDPPKERRKTKKSEASVDQQISLFDPPKERRDTKRSVARLNQQSSLFDPPNTEKSDARLDQQSNDDKSRNQSRSIPNTEDSSLAGIVRWADNLDLRVAQLRPLPLSSAANYESSTDEYQQRQELFLETKKLVENIQKGARENYIQPSRKHGRELSILFGSILKFFSAAPHDEHQSPFEECLAVLSLMDQWNLSKHKRHYHYTILTAVHEQRWEQASSLFLQQIDPNVSSPIEISVSSPVGLYAIARASQEREEQGALVVEQVMDAALNLSIMSPSEQEKYVLAAGTALGLAGEWQALVEYLENSYNATRLGKPFVAATMHACILCNQHDEALRIFRTSSGGELAISSEFHLGGELYQVSPLCRDLAMRAMGKSVQGANSDKAIQLFQQVIEDDLTVSVEALRGVVGACEQDNKWEDAVGVIFFYLSAVRGDARNTRLVPGSELHIPQVEERSAYMETHNPTVLSAGSGELLSSVMRTCNASRKPGVALLCFQLFENSLPASLLSTIQNGTQHSIVNIPEPYGSIEETLIPFIEFVDNTEELLCATMSSLCGVKGFHEATTMFERVKEHLTASGGKKLVSELHLATAAQIYDFALSQALNEPSRREWESAHRHIHRITRALHSIENTQLSTNQLIIISSALAAALRSCTLASQPEAGLLLAQQTRVSLSNNGGENATSLFRNQEDTVSKKDLLQSDSLLAEKMLALHATNQVDIALDLFQSAMDSEETSIEECPQSCNAAMTILADNNEMDEAIELFRALVSSTPNLDSFLKAAQIFANARRWDDVSDVYHVALDKSCLSERLGLLAMKAVHEMSAAGRLRLLRGIIDETARSSGTSSMHWMESCYFKVKESLGFNTARLLMWWGDPNTSHLDELQFALEVFETRRAAGLKPKNRVARLIVSHACKANERYVPADKKEIGRVPRDTNEWANLLKRVLEEVAGTTMENEKDFIDGAAIALRRHHCDQECVEFVEKALARGVRVHQVAINEALQAANDAGISHEANGIRLMLLEDSS